MKAAIVLVECEYNENLGMIARAMKNFEQTELLLVRPIADKESNTTKSRAMHAKDTLKKAKKFNSLKAALKKSTYSAAFTARPAKGEHKGKKALSLKEFTKTFTKSNASIALVFGRESSGLTKEEINKCDFTVSIPTNKKYSSLNISHAITIALYSLYSEKPRKLFETATKTTKKTAIKKFTELANANPKIRNKKSVSKSFQSIISRTPATETELKGITGVLSESLKKLKKKTVIK